GEPRQIDLNDLIRPEEFVKPAPEMPARLDHDGARLADIDPHHLEEDRVGALHAMRHDHDGDAADYQCRARSEREPRPGIDAAAPDAIAVMQRANPRRRSPWLGEVCRLLAVKMRIEIVVQSMPVRFGGERRIVDDAEQRPLDAGLYEGAQQTHRIAAPA